jgi:hypothetical protein
MLDTRRRAVLDLYIICDENAKYVGENDGQYTGLTFAVE